MAEVHEFGRIADDGTVYVRTPDGGERVVGSWQAGTADEAFAFYGRRYDDLAAEIAILEARVTSPGADPRAIASGAERLRESLATASVVGDLAALDQRLTKLLGAVEQRAAERAAARARAAEEAAHKKRALVTEAQQLSGSSDWRATGDRFRAIVEEWKAIRGVDRKLDSELWDAFATARKEFDHRRRAHFADLERQRHDAAERKEALATEAEKLAESDDWGATARRFRDLMSEWKGAGRAGRPADDELWARFKTAQDTFFGRRNAALAQRDSEFTDNLAAKEALLAEAESLDPASDLESARKRLRVIHDKWEAIGKVPREDMHRLEDRLATVERRVREAGDSARPYQVTESPLVIRLRESVTKLEHRLERARAAGDEKLAADTEASLATQREWLAQAERSG